MPSSADVDALLAGGTDAIVPIITMMARAYTRGQGFDGDQPNAEIGAVITTASARLAANPKQLGNTETAGPFSEAVVGGFNGWTLAEQFVLNRYRKRAM
ncbi:MULTISPECIES: hypothetical protein [Mycobacterium avium complex (MAC)]|jgi:hypothetical protein|uniref:Uncharacterized protein n=3 Tax=Mycobacterium avium complex (MAC) TaxID=120793 RepID=A0ABX3TGB4_9MYCO|nr:MULTISPECIES: hypothetical protein [Mycobacterium avium complex (MAC)]ETB15879.1 hypothetical protein O983_28020 [Mycobacterium avium 09-5983]ETB35608.1 hypothetical protein N602_26280 [Mycobacterium avium subsp. hominissuis 10-5606]AXO25193.1 hypothetical protein DFS55_23425 [Mycobacterium avium subsp. hominissuis]MBG0730200.1 hypothetical protein [Mycobacterium avium]MBZ4548923.1 hypothetical protein [Mycobacterium avium subsp. hominissuis]